MILVIKHSCEHLVSIRLPKVGGVRTAEHIRTAVHSPEALRCSETQPKGRAAETGLTKHASPLRRERCRIKIGKARTSWVIAASPRCRTIREEVLADSGRG